MNIPVSDEDKLFWWKNLALNLNDEMLARDRRIYELEQQLANTWQPVNPIDMVDNKYDDAEIKLCYRRPQAQDSATAPTLTRAGLQEVEGNE